MANGFSSLLLTNSKNSNCFHDNVSVEAEDDHCRPLVAMMMARSQVPWQSPSDTGWEEAEKRIYFYGFLPAATTLRAVPMWHALTFVAKRSEQRVSCSEPTLGDTFTNISVLQFPPILHMKQ